MKNLSIFNEKRIVIKIGSSLLVSNNKFNSKWLEGFIEDLIFLKKILNLDDQHKYNYYLIGKKKFILGFKNYLKNIK